MGKLLLLTTVVLMLASSGRPLQVSKQSTFPHLATGFSGQHVGVALETLMNRLEELMLLWQIKTEPLYSKIKSSAYISTHLNTLGPE